MVASWTGELITQSCGRWRSKRKIKTKPICHSIHSPAHNITSTEFKQIFYLSRLKAKLLCDMIWKIWYLSFINLLWKDMNRRNWGQVYRQYCSSINQSSKCLKQLPWFWEFYWRARKSIVLVKLAGICCVWLLQVMPTGGQCLWTLKISQKVWWLSIVDPFFILGWNWL